MDNIEWAMQMACFTCAGIGVIWLAIDWLVKRIRKSSTSKKAKQ